MPSNGMRVAVVGAGIVGLSAAWFLAQRGHKVVLHERFPLFHDRGSSHGRTRIVRRAYPDAFFTACMTEAYPRWAELERESGRRLVDECGLIYFGDRDAPNVISMVAALTDLQVPHQVLSPSECREMIPGARLLPAEVGVFTPEAGSVNAAAALRATYDLAISHGIDVRIGKADPFALEREFDAVILAAGPWIAEYVELDTKVTLQTFGYVQADASGPVWIDDVGLTYGFPSDDRGQKIGAHLPGPATDPDDPHEPNESQIAQLREVAERRFGITNPEVQDITTCLYTSTPDEMFRLGRLGEKIVFASACSGHGFKLGPWTGRTLADIAEGGEIPRAFEWPKPSRITPTFGGDE